MKTLHIEPSAPPPRPKKEGDEDGEEDSNITTSASRLVAPKATPEDSLIDSYSTSEEDDDEEEYTGEAMQSEMLNRMDTRDDVFLEEVVEEDEEEEEESTAVSHTQTSTVGDSAQDTIEETAVMAKQLLLKQISDAGSGSSGSVSTLQQPTSESILLGSGSSLPAKLARSSPLPSASEPAPHSTACLIQPPPMNAPRRRAKNLTFTLSLSNPTKLNGEGRLWRRRRIAPPLPPPIIQCRSCGLSPGSPTYYQHHTKWCHTGAHALDVFVSPDTDILPEPWPSIPSTSTHSPTGGPHSPLAAAPAPGPSTSHYYRLPRVGADTPLRRHPLPHSSLTAAIHDFSDDEDEDDEVCPHRPLLGAPSPPPSPTHATAASTMSSSSSQHIPCNKSKSLEKYKSTSTRERRKNRLLSPVSGSDPSFR